MHTHSMNVKQPQVNSRNMIRDDGIKPQIHVQTYVVVAALPLGALSIFTFLSSVTPAIQRAQPELARNVENFLRSAAEVMCRDGYPLNL